MISIRQSTVDSESKLGSGTFLEISISHEEGLMSSKVDKEHMCKMGILAAGSAVFHTSQKLPEKST